LRNMLIYILFVSSTRRHTRCYRDWSSDVCSSDLCECYVYYFGTKEAQNIHSNFLQDLGIARAPGSTNRGIPAINVPGYADMGDRDRKSSCRERECIKGVDEQVYKRVR